MTNLKLVKGNSTTDLSSGRPQIRRVDFDLNEGMSRYWFMNNSVITHFNNAFHMIFPDGERFFIRSVKRFAADLKNPQLRENVKAFIGQEVQHGKEHEKMWDILRSQGLPADAFLKFYTSTAYDTLEQTILNRLGEKGFGGKLALSVTAAAEHYTAILAETGLQDGYLQGIPEAMAELMRWHGAEEIEHKAVAYDVLREIDPDYGIRILGYTVATVLLWSYTIVGQIWFIAGDKELTLSRLFRDLAGFGRFSSIAGGAILKNWFAYFNPDFHPDQIPSEALAARYFAESEYYRKRALAD